MAPIRSSVDPQAFVDALEVAGVGVYFVDPTRRITFWSKGAEQISGWTSEEVLGLRCAAEILVHVDEHGRRMCKHHCPLLHAMRTNDRHRIDVFLRHRAGHRLPVHVRTLPLRDGDGNVLGGIEVFTDLSDRLAELEKLKALEAAAYVDAVTGVPNRRYFELAHRGRALEADRIGTTYGLAVADIDDFKRVNDTFGHANGDRVLQAVARALTARTRPQDVVARWGGEEFVLLLGCNSPQELRAALEWRRSLIAGTEVPLEYGEMRVTVSIGGRLVAPGETPEEAFRDADAALYAAKRAGKDRVVIG
ncbi:MAG: sensor domain-containing diguanylate cyclase [Myxococcota bacterium]